MAVHTEGNHITRASGVDLSTSLYFIVKMNSSRQLVLASSSSDNFEGVVNYPTAAGIGVNVDIFVRNMSGTGKVVAGGTFNVGDALTSDANGRAVATTTSGAQLIGYAEEQSTAVGQICEYRACDKKY